MLSYDQALQLIQDSLASLHRSGFMEASLDPDW